MAFPVLVNRGGGAAAAAGDRLKADIEAAFAKAGTTAEVRLLSGDEMSEAIGAAIGRCERLAVAGGDGTLSCASAALIGNPDAPALAILPLGTLNHLARDLHIPSELDAAADVAVNGPVRAIDVATVNDRHFVNNASIGLYPMMVRSREAARARHGLPKWLASVPAAWNALHRLPHHRLRLHVEGLDRTVVTPLLFVGNNDYRLDRGALGTRTSLEDGRLSVFAVARHSRAGLLWFAARALVGRTNRDTDFEALGNVAALTVEAHGQQVSLGLDGEVVKMQFPLKFSVQRKALRVIAPDVAEPDDRCG